MAGDDLSGGARILSRRELYDLLWERPLGAIALELGLSEVGLKGLCRRHLVTLPTASYWRRRTEGRRVFKPALADVSDDRLRLIVIR